MSNSLKVIQPNIITSARYDYTVTEKRIIYHIIKNIQDKMKSGIAETLFGDLLLSIPMKELVKHEHYRRVKINLISLRKKSFTITTWIDPTGKGEDGWLDVGFVNYTEYEEASGNVVFEVSKKMVPYLLEVARGFTSYTLMVALSLKSSYSQRFYECCSRFKSTGVWNISVEDLKVMLVLEDKYLVYTHFKHRVLEVAQKELKALFDNGECDLYFVYDEKKTGKRVTDLTFKIFSKQKAEVTAIKNDDLQYISNVLRNTFQKDHEHKFAKYAINELFNMPGALTKFAKRLMQLEEDIAQGKMKSDGLPKLVRHILRDDYKIYLR